MHHPLDDLGLLAHPRLLYRNQDRIASVEAERGVSPFLVDAYNRQHNYLRISLTERCNLRCASSIRILSFLALPSQPPHAAHAYVLCAHPERIRIRARC